MSSYYQTLMLQRLHPQDADEARARLMKALVSDGWLAPAEGGNPATSKTFLPTAKLKDACLWLKTPHAFSEFGELKVVSGSVFVGLELGQIETMTCPSCATAIEFDAIFPAVERAIDTFVASGRIGTLECPHCAAASDAREWISDPLLTFSHLSLTVRDWPQLAREHWSIDFPGMIQAICGSPVTQSWGRL